jgi:hypothetical protein
VVVVVDYWKSSFERRVGWVRESVRRGLGGGVRESSLERRSGSWRRSWRSVEGLKVRRWAKG